MHYEEQHLGAEILTDAELQLMTDAGLITAKPKILTDAELQSMTGAAIVALYPLAMPLPNTVELVRWQIEGTGTEYRPVFWTNVYGRKVITALKQKGYYTQQDAAAQLTLTNAERIKAMQSGMTTIDFGAINAASPAPTENPEMYRQLVISDVVNKEIGVQQCWNLAKLSFFPQDAAIAMSKPELGRITAYDDSCISLDCWYKMYLAGVKINLCEVKYRFSRTSCRYHDTDTYIRSLEHEYDFKNFLSLLKLYRSAGIEMQTAYEPFTPGKNNPLRLRAIKGVNIGRTKNEVLGWALLTGGAPTKVMEHKPFYMLDPALKTETWRLKKQAGISYLDWIDKRNYLEAWIAVDFVQIAGAARHNPNMVDFAILEKYRALGYVDGEANRVVFIEQVCRFRERVLAHALLRTFEMLNVSQLEDANSLVLLINKFAQDAVSPLEEIYKAEFLQVVDEHGTPQGTRREVRFLETDKFKYNGVEMSITQALRLQYEAAIWILIANQPKYGGRLNDLLNPNVKLDTVAENKLRKSFQMDPWQNPFLIYDMAASKAAGTPVYTNTAAHIAQGGVAQVQDDFVSKTGMDKAMETWNKYKRTSVGNMKYATPPDISKNNAAWILAALAAAGALFVMKG